MLPSEYNSRPFCLPKWTLRGSSSLSKDPQITSEKGLGDGLVLRGWTEGAGGKGDSQMIGKIHGSRGDVHPLPLDSPAMPSAIA